MYAQELLVHDGGERQRAERLHARLVNPIGILVFALEFEGEVIRQMSAFMITTEEEERIWVPDLEGPQIQDTLQKKYEYRRSIRI